MKICYLKAQRHEQQHIAPRRSWHGKEIGLLRALFPAASKEELEAAFPHRDFRNISRAASRYGIKRLEPWGDYNWTREEKHIMRVFYPCSDWETLQKKLPGRSIPAIIRMGDALNLKRTLGPKDSSALSPEQHHDQLAQTYFKDARQEHDYARELAIIQAGVLAMVTQINAGRSQDKEDAK